jgi:hypothetical protein
MRFHNDSVFFWRPAALLDVGIQVIVPSEGQNRILCISSLQTYTTLKQGNHNEPFSALFSDASLEL